MTQPLDSTIFDAQREHWESTLSANADMFGFEPSESAMAAAAILGENGVSEILGLGAGQGRDTLFLASEGVEVTALDYTDAAEPQETIVLDMSNL